MSKDPSADIYKLLDDAGLNAGNLLTSRKSLSTLVSEIRVRIATNITQYIIEREAGKENDGSET